MSAHDEARPVFLVNTGELDDSGRELYHVSRGERFPMADNERVYTAADYEALRAEVERLREDRNALRSTVAEQEMRLGNEIDRAEAAEASLDDFIEATEHYFNTGETAPLRAALNDQGQDNSEASK